MLVWKFRLRFNLSRRPYLGFQYNKRQRFPVLLHQIALECRQQQVKRSKTGFIL